MYLMYDEQLVAHRYQHNRNKCPDSIMEVKKLPDLLGNYNRPTDRPTDRRTQYLTQRLTKCLKRMYVSIYIKRYIERYVLSQQCYNRQTYGQTDRQILSVKFAWCLKIIFEIMCRKNMYENVEDDFINNCLSIKSIASQ